MALPSDLPLIQAPMAGGPSTPELTAEVSRAGGYGFVAGGYLSSDGLRQMIARTRTLTGAPFGVNLFVPSTPGDKGEVVAYASCLVPEAERLGVALGEALWEDDGYDAKLDVVVSDRVHMTSFTFGCPTSEIVDRLHRAEVLVAVTVTSAAESSAARDAGADLLLVQGTEAGGHQGGFISTSANETPLLRLLEEVCDVCDLPAVGSGGVMTGIDVAAVLETGAVAAQLGTAFLCAREAGTSAPYRRALLDGEYSDTIVTRAYSGRFARGLANRFALEHDSQAPRAYPEVHHLTRPLRSAATEAGDSSVPNLWAGTGWRNVAAAPAAEIIRRIAGDAKRSAP
jgi:nitronate monooxygenase